MSEAIPNLELLLRQALSPVEPPEGLVTRVESMLTSITDLAAEELEGWELSAMGDPRNWVRPAAALVLGSAAGTALVLLRARHRGRSPQALDQLRRTAGQTVRDAGEEALRVFGELNRRSQR